MKRTSYFKLLLSVAVSLATLSALGAELVIQIDNIQSETGKIFVQVLKGEEGFKKEESFDSAVLDATIPSTTATFEVPEGEYAIRLYHDVNDDGEMNFNAIGIPKEPYGFSNNAKPRFSAPGWKRVKFTVSEGTTTQQIELSN